jgi:ABC-type molybdate transport system substrate-binding protein
LPDALAVGADYGLTVMTTASPAAYRFAMFILSLQGQRVLENYGFVAPALTQCSTGLWTESNRCL